MPPNKQLSEVKRAKVIVLSGKEYSQVEIARKIEDQKQEFKQ